MDNTARRELRRASALPFHWTQLIGLCQLIHSGKIISRGLGAELAEEQIARKIGRQRSFDSRCEEWRSGSQIRNSDRRESSGRVSLGDVMTAIDG